MPGSKAPRFSVDFLTEGEILVRGTLDPHEALKVVFEEAWDEGDIDDRLYEVARPHFPDDPEPTQKAINEFADFEAFARYLDEELGPRPKGCSLDRIDTDGDYEPGNIRWATALEQRHNRSKKTPEEWSR